MTVSIEMKMRKFKCTFIYHIQCCVCAHTKGECHEKKEIHKLSLGFFIDATIALNYYTKKLRDEPLKWWKKESKMNAYKNIQMHIHIAR